MSAGDVDHVARVCRALIDGVAPALAASPRFARMAAGTPEQKQERMLDFIGTTVYSRLVAQVAAENDDQERRMDALIDNLHLYSGASAPEIADATERSMLMDFVRDVAIRQAGGESYDDVVGHLRAVGYVLRVGAAGGLEIVKAVPRGAPVVSAMDFSETDDSQVRLVAFLNALRYMTPQPLLEYDETYVRTFHYMTGYEIIKVVAGGDASAASELGRFLTTSMNTARVSNPDMERKIRGLYTEDVRRRNMLGTVNEKIQFHVSRRRMRMVELAGIYALIVALVVYYHTINKRIVTDGRHAMATMVILTAASLYATVLVARLTINRVYGVPE